MTVGGIQVELSEEKQAALTKNGVASQTITLGVRPEHIALMGDGAQMLHGTVDVSEMMGSAVHLHVNVLGKDAIIIVQTMDLQGVVNTDFSMGPGYRLHLWRQRGPRVRQGKRQESGGLKHW